MIKSSLARYCFCLFIAFFIITSCANNSNENAKQSSKQDISYEIFTTNYGYGYNIYVNGKLYISQPNIPAIAGTAGFKTEKDAHKTAELAISKIKQGITPPTITLNELRAYGIDITK